VTEAEVIVVGERGRKQRLDRYLADCERWGSRSQIQRLIESGNVEVDGHVAKASLVLRPGQTIRVVPSPPPTSELIEAENIPLDVIHEDEALLVINKPAGLVVHPAAGNWRGTLVSALLYHWGGAPAGLDPLRPGLVHRLDKDTSGVIVIAKDASTLAELSRQFRKREVEKRYVALVRGRMRDRRGVLDAPIGRNPGHRKRMAVRIGGRAAVTAYEVIATGKEVTYVRLFPRTGRTHQLRVHLAALGHPIVGDLVYGGGRGAQQAPIIGRQALHAERLTFAHPRTGERVSFKAAQPDDFVAARRACVFDLDKE
jgi:23S rRNA pseudouridine1911/1915/1917 synthase